MSPARSSLRAAFVAACLVWAVDASAAETDFLYFFDKHPNQVRRVDTCGHWRDGSAHGYYRVIEAYEFGQSFLYVQWMTDYDFQRSETHALATAAFPEIDKERAEIILSQIQCSAAGALTRVEAQANFAHEDRWYRLQLELAQAPGKYTLQFVPLPSVPAKP